MWQMPKVSEALTTYLLVTKVQVSALKVLQGVLIEARRDPKGTGRIVLFKLVSSNEFLCLEIVLSFCRKLFHSTGLVKAFVRSNYRV